MQKEYSAKIVVDSFIQKQNIVLDVNFLVMNQKMLCGNCRHEIVLDSVKVINKHTKNKKSQTIRVMHIGNSYLCLVNSCQCLDPTGRDTSLVGSRYPFNKMVSKNPLKQVIPNWVI